MTQWVLAPQPAPHLIQKLARPPPALVKQLCSTWIHSQLQQRHGTLVAVFQEVGAEGGRPGAYLDSRTPSAGAHACLHKRFGCDGVGNVVAHVSSPGRWVAGAGDTHRGLTYRCWRWSPHLCSTRRRSCSSHSPERDYTHDSLLLLGWAACSGRVGLHAQERGRGGGNAADQISLEVRHNKTGCPRVCGV